MACIKAGKVMQTKKSGEDMKLKFRQLSWLIIIMVGATLGSIKVLNYFFYISSDMVVLQLILDWLFAMIIIAFLVNFSFHELKKMQEELMGNVGSNMEFKKRLQHLMAHTQDGIVLMDSKGNLINTNLPFSKITGYSTGKLAGKNIVDIMAQDYKTFIIKQMSDYKNVGERHLFVEFLNKEGCVIPIELSLLKISVEGSDICFQCIARGVNTSVGISNMLKEAEANGNPEKQQDCKIIPGVIVI
jgi:PAS domain S-box-containing protein